MGDMIRKQYYQYCPECNRGLTPGAAGGSNLADSAHGAGKRQCDNRRRMPVMFPLFLTVGTVFGALAAVSAYLISYHEYRQRMLRLDQDPRRMALGTAAVTFAVFLLASIGLSFVL